MPTIPSVTILPETDPVFTHFDEYESGGVKVLCSKRNIADNLTDVPEQKVFLSFYQSEYAYAFNLVIYGYFPDGFIPTKPVFDAEMIERDIPVNSQSECTFLTTRIISIDYPQQHSSYSLWEIRVTYCIDFSSMYALKKAEAIQLNLVSPEGQPITSSIFTIPKRLSPFFNVSRQKLEVSQEIIYTGVKIAPLEPLVVFNAHANPDEVNKVHLIIYAFIPTGYTPTTVMLIPDATTPGIVLPIEGEDPENNIQVAIRTISISYDLATRYPDNQFGKYDMWKIHFNYTDSSAQMLRVCYSIGDPVTTRGTVTSVQRT